MRRDLPSQTAIRLARGVVALGRIPPYDGLLPGGAAELTERLLVASGVMPSWAPKVWERAWLRAPMLRVAELAVPGQVMATTLRKRFVDDRVRAAIEGGATQVLVVAAGFDTLCARLAPRYRHVQWIEVDHPATSRVKRAGMARLGDVPENLSFEAADLSRRELRDALEGLPWDREAQSVIVVEGLLMYLTRSDVERLLRAIVALSGDGSCLVTTFVDEDVNRATWARFGESALAAIGEPFRWTIRKSAVAGFLERQGWQVVPGSQDLRALYLADSPLDDAPLASVEHLACASRIEPTHP